MAGTFLEGALFGLYRKRSAGEALRLVRGASASEDAPADNLTAAAFQQFDATPGAVPFGTFADGQPLKLPAAIANQSGITVGASGSGKTRFLLTRIETELAWNLGLPAFGVPAPLDYRSETELLDPKTETFDEARKLVAALWRRLPEDRRPEFAAFVRVLDWTAERVTPLDLFANDGLTSDAFLAHQRVEIEVAASSQTFTDSVRALYFAYGRFLTLKTYPLNLAYARRFLRDAAFRARELRSLPSRDVAAYFHALDDTVPRQTIDAFLRRLEYALAFPEIAASVGLPSDARARLLAPMHARLTLGNYGPGTRLPLGKALERASHRLIDLLRTLPRRDPATPFLLLLEEAAVLLSQSGELAEPLANASRTFRKFAVGVQLAAQDFSNALPKPLVRTLLLNARWLAVFQSRDEAEWLASFADDLPQFTGTSAQRRAAFVKEIQNLPPRSAYLHVKGHRPVRFASLSFPDAAERSGSSDAELLALFDREITPRSTVRITDAEAAIAAWEAAVVGAASSHAERPARPKGIADLLGEDAP